MSVSFSGDNDLAAEKKRARLSMSHFVNVGSENVMAEEA